MEIITLDATTSTNDYLLSLNTERDLCVVTDYQSAGKGMGTNVWESERGKNLLFSLLVHPLWLGIQKQYLMSMVQAVSLWEALSDYVENPTLLTIKWPNDIYYKDCKLSGTRIDLNLQGMKIQDMVIGTGVNVNQLQFTGTAPNPVSLSQISGLTYSLSQILSSIIDAFERNYALLRSGAEQYIIRCYHEHLYRRVGMYRYRDIHGEFQAEMVGVASNGILTLRRADGTLSKYEFKELSIVL
ncbi:MAG: biotin--[acetyl-CoA-carboxylase] ligase [Prevotella sp.]|nr:biotin--[acetyl-CoA-carboxylase] ligase [Prevotella sp.]